jgi:hypothetical protein
MELLRNSARIARVDDLSRIPGRHSFHYEPDFCGRMNVVLDQRSPDRVHFSCNVGLIVGQEYVLSDDDEPAIRIRITRSSDNHYAASVVES